VGKSANGIELHRPLGVDLRGGFRREVDRFEQLAEFSRRQVPPGTLRDSPQDQRAEAFAPWR